MYKRKKTAKVEELVNNIEFLNTVERHCKDGASFNYACALGGCTQIVAAKLRVKWPAFNDLAVKYAKTAKGFASFQNENKDRKRIRNHLKPSEVNCEELRKSHAFVLFENVWINMYSQEDRLKRKYEISKQDFVEGYQAAKQIMDEYVLRLAKDE